MNQRGGRTLIEDSVEELSSCCLWKMEMLLTLKSFHFYYFTINVTVSWYSSIAK